MNPRFKTNLIEHAKAVTLWARRRGARTWMDGDDLSLRITLNGREQRLRAQCVGFRGSSLAYFPTFDANAVGLVGWFAHPVQSWPISLSKQLFKQVATEVGIDVPASWSDSRAATEAYLIKQDRSAFGQGMRGPFAPGSDDPRAQTAAGEYADAFVTPRIARAWYWGPRLAVLECFEMPTIVGDGRRSYRQLLTDALARDVALPEGWADLGRWQGLDEEQPVAPGQQVLADYRYVSPFNPTVYGDHDRLSELRGSSLVTRFEAAGQAIVPRLPVRDERGRTRDVVFVLDAIVDARDRPWFLEINSNPQLHPGLYPLMLDRLFDLE